MRESYFLGEFESHFEARISGMYVIFMCHQKYVEMESKPWNKPQSEYTHICIYMCRDLGNCIDILYTMRKYILNDIYEKLPMHYYFNVIDRF